MRGLEQALTIAYRSGKGSALMSEEFALGEVLLDGSAMDCYKPVPRTLPIQLVDGLGQYLFTGSSLSLDQQSRVANLGGFPGAAQHRQHWARPGHKTQTRELS